MHRHVPPDNRGKDTARIAEAIQAIAARHGDRMGLDVPLSRMTTLRIGGPALAICRLHTPEDARRFLENARERDIPVVFLGGGSNVLADDAGFQGLVMHVATTDLVIRGDTVRAGAGLGFDALVTASLEAGLAGLEFASGIPGTLGGALVGNAGCYGHEISEFLVEATILRADGRVETVGPEDFAFAYRHTAYKDRSDLVLDAVLRLRRGDTAAAGETRLGIIAERRRKHPVDLPCAGSYFRNLPPDSPGGRRRAAGSLLDQIGAREMREGDAAVFARHANIIVNLGEAASRDVLTLAERMRAAVAERFGVRLREEVRHLTRFGWQTGA
ncbi:UDP-N-acetylmuramate dehydrogenase [bacterium]|nr:UDP-N-acetylmuramate dehydrogenase [bacterium]MBU1674871.1 UDP-N-acetylmuramate dehydrogenase [bacterium]